jgi:hypothetical protein
VLVSGPMVTTSSPIDRLRDSLLWLAAPAEQQLSELISMGLCTCADELARVFDDAVRRIAGPRRPILPLATLQLLEDLDEQLARMCDDPEAWTLTSLCERTEWQRVRRTARRALLALSDRRPTLERPVAIH